MKVQTLLWQLPSSLAFHFLCDEICVLHCLVLFIHHSENNGKQCVLMMSVLMLIFLRLEQ